MRAAAGLLAFLLPLAANAATYTLADQNGMPTCSWVNLTIQGQFYYGDVHYERCHPHGLTLAGSGVLTKIKGAAGHLGRVDGIPDLRF